MNRTDIWSTWAVLYVAATSIISIVTGSLYYEQNGSNWPSDGSVTESFALVGIISGVIVAITAFITMPGIDGASQTRIDIITKRIYRVMFEICISVCSYTMVSLAAIYLYVKHSGALINPSNVKDGIVKTEHVVTISYVYFTMVLIHIFFATPHMTYMLMRAWYPCKACNTTMRISTATGQPVETSNAYRHQVKQIVELVPFFGKVCGSHKMHVDGVPLSFLVDGTCDADLVPMYRDAARTLIARLESMYELHTARI